MQSTNIEKNYALLRGFNWFLSILIFSGAILLLLKSSSGNLYTLMGGLFVLGLSANYFGSAVAINPNLTTMLGYPVVVGRSLRKILLVSNVLLSLLGLGIIIACIATQQYPASISGVLYLAVSGLNVVALRHGTA